MTKGGLPESSPARSYMTRDIRVLYQAVERIEDHIATKQKLLDVLQAGHANAAFGSPLRAKLAREIEQAAIELGALHAERDQLRREITALRVENTRQGLRECSKCRAYKPPEAFSPDRRVRSGKQSRCRDCRNTWLYRYRHGEK